jgi:two-component system, OmpR family, KDP operon response regulator KdpE
MEGEMSDPVGPDAPGGRVLLVDDDVALSHAVALALEAADYTVRTAPNGREGLRTLYDWQPDIVVLDVMMPQLDGWETCRRIREFSDVPILMLTGRAADGDVVKGLRGGADGYMPKPFTVAVLLARIDALLRRSRLAGVPPRARVVVTGDLRVDLTRREVSVGGRQIDLTPTEYRLLAALAARPGEIIEHRELLTQVWGPDCVDEDLYLKLYVRYLRQKIELDPSRPTRVLTRRGVGYYLAADRSDS